jgi:TPR repeat protein
MFASSCTVKKAVTYEQRKLHTDAIAAQPGWEVERTTIGTYAPYLWAGAGGGIGYALQEDTGEDSDNQGLGYGLLAGLAVGYLIDQVVMPDQTKFGMKPGEEYEWVQQFNRQKNRQYKLAYDDPNSDHLYLAPSNKLEQFWAKEAEVNVLDRENDPSKIFISSVELKDENRSGRIEANESASVEIEVLNDDELVLKEVDLELEVQGQNVAGLNPQLKGGLRPVLPGERKTFVYNLPPVITLEGGEVMVEVTLKVNGERLRNQSNRLERASFFQNGPFTAPSKTSGNRDRLTAVEGLYGFKKLNFSDGIQSLEEAARGGDAVAKMWKAVLWQERPVLFAYRSERELDQLVDGAIAVLQDRASQNDLESIFLLGQAYRHGLGVEKDERIADVLLQKAAEEDYPYAVVGLGVQQMIEEQPQAISTLKEAVRDGSTYAEVVLAQAYHYGIAGLDPDPSAAKRHYRRAKEAGVVEAFHSEATGWTEGTLGAPDIEQAMESWRAAADLGDTWAMYEIAGRYLNDKGGVPKDAEKAEYWFKKAAENDNTTAMQSLAYLYVSGDMGYRNFKSAEFWSKKSAILGNGASAALLGKLYQAKDVEGVEYNEVLARYWTREASALGEEVEDLNSYYFPGMGLLENFELKERVRVTQYYDGTVERDVYYDPLADMLNAGFGMLFQNLMPSEDRLNDAVFVHDIPDGKIYAATLNRSTDTPVNLRPGQKVTILGRGRIKLGSFAGSTNAEGTNDPLLQKYNLVSRYSHGCLLMRIGEDGDWRKVGKELVFEAEEYGNLQLAVNDGDYMNNGNYFDVKVIVEE